MPVPPSEGEGVEGPTPAPNTLNQAAAGWPGVLEDLVNNCIIIDGHCYLLSTALVFPEEEGMMQQSSVSISLNF